MSEDPRELARRLAEEAKQRHQASSAPAEDPRELARRLAEEAKQRAAQAAPPDAEDESGRLVEEAGTGRPLTAAEALERARSARKSGTAPSGKGGTGGTPRAPSPHAEGDLEPTVAIPGGTAVVVSRLVTGLVPEGSVLTQEPIHQVEVFRALWRAHLARGRQDQDLQLVALANALLDAVDRLPAGRIVAARVALSGAEWAVWVDLDRTVLIGAAQPADVYLAGS